MSSFEERGAPRTGGFICLIVLAGVAFVSVLAALFVKPTFKRDRKDSSLPTVSVVQKLLDEPIPDDIIEYKYDAKD